MDSADYGEHQHMIAGGVVIVLNGEERALPAEMTLTTLLDTLEIDKRLVALAYNGDVVPRDSYKEVTVRQGDRVEIVRMVGGG